MSSGRLSGRMSRSWTCVGAMKPVPRCLKRCAAKILKANQASSATSVAMISHMSICDAVPIQANRSPSQLIHDGQLDGSRGFFFFSVDELSQRRVLTVFSLARFGSRLTTCTAWSISARVTTGFCATAGMQTASASASASLRILARASGAEGTTKLLLDVPDFQLGAAIQVHAEAGGDIEGLDEQQRQ